MLHYLLTFLFSIPLVLFAEKPVTKEEKPHYQILYINGPSSSGKSTLIKQLQQTFNDPYLHIGIDQLIGMMPEKVNNWKGGDAPLGFSWKAAKDNEGKILQLLQVGSFAKKITDMLKQIVQVMAESGFLIIIDDIAFGKEEVDAWRKALSGYKVLYIGIHAPLPLLEERERIRGDRLIGSARAQFSVVHQGVSYDLEFDTSNLTMDEIAKTIHTKVY